MTTVAFTHCPFRELAEAFPDLVCHLHRGIVEGMVQGVPNAEVAVETFATLADRDPCRLTWSSGRLNPGLDSCWPANCRGGNVSTTETSTNTIILTDTAVAKVGELIKQEGNPELALRVAVRPGGCSGFSYEMFFDSDIADDDLQSSFGDVKVVVDPASASLIVGRHPRLQGRPAGRRVQHQQPQRHPQLRLRPVLQLTC